MQLIVREVRVSGKEALAEACSVINETTQGFGEGLQKVFTYVYHREHQHLLSAILYHTADIFLLGKLDRCEQLTDVPLTCY